MYMYVIKIAAKRIVDFKVNLLLLHDFKSLYQSTYYNILYTCTCIYIYTQI